MEEQNPVKQFNSEIDSAFSAAFMADKGGNQKWDMLMGSYEAKPLSKEEKDMLLNSQMKIARGAFPIELRRVYEQIVAKYSALASGNQALTSAVNGFNMEGKVIEYYQKIKPFGGLSDIFKNASAGTAKYSQGLQKEKQMTIKCKSCGAPRLEEMQYDKCLFCGSELFEKSEG